MIKDIMTANESIAPNSREMEILKEHFPSCFHSDGSFDLVRFQEFLSDKVAVTNDGYEIRFLGKNYARLLASVDTTTVIVPDEEHNSKPENAHSENVYISGDNLDGLKHLLKSYDSPLEKDNITTDIEEVVVYGKIPRSSIAIPTITGSMYSPDFMYVVKKTSGEKELNIVVETKDVEGKDVLRGTEAAKIECARVFFEILSKEGYTVHFRDQLSNKQMVQIINEVLRM